MLTGSLPLGESLPAVSYTHLQNSYEYKILGQPEVRWIKIEDTYGIEVEYVRNGANNSRTHVCTYYFFNDNLFATILL